MQQNIQAIQHIINTFADSQRHSAIPVRLLRQTISSKVRYEETHLHPYW